MGCEKFRDGGMGVGGVRASMERRWLINAKTTVMRQRKWQEVRMQKEQEEMKKVAEILEKRKRERARLAAYIHMQPAKCAVNATKCTRKVTKRSNWNTCLMEDQELILRLREKSAVARNSYNQRADIAADDLWQGSEKGQHYGTYTNSYRKGYHAPEHNFLMATRYMDDTAYEIYSNPERDHNDSDQVSEASAAKGSIRSEPLRSAIWAPDVPTYASMAEEVRYQPAAKAKRFSAIASEKEDDHQPGLRLEKHFQAPATKSNHRVVSKLAESHAEAYSRAASSAALGQKESSSKPDSDLREEILKARLANEAATARLIAEVSAIESRLEDCNRSLQPLDFREGESEGITGELNQYTSDTDPLSGESCGETDSNFSSDSDEVASASFQKTTTDRNENGLGKPQHEAFQPCKQVIEKKVVAAASDPQPSNDIDWNTVTVGSPESCHDMQMVSTETNSRNEEKARSYEDQKSHRSSKIMAAAADNPHTETSSEIDWNLVTASSPESCEKIEGNSFQATREACTYHKEVKAGSEESPAGTSEGKAATTVKSRKDSPQVWEIDWDNHTDRWLNNRKDSNQIKQQARPSSLSGIGEWRLPANQNSVRQQQTEDSVSLREERQRIESCSRRPPIIPEGNGNSCRARVELPVLPLHHLNLGISQPMYRNCMQTHSVQPGYHQAENNLQDASRGVGFGKRFDSSPDKENYRKSQSGALTEEEEKIFASLERLDWKLAALHTRSVSTGRDSYVSQGEFSTKSAPAVMGPPIKKLGHAGVHSAKKPIPYSTVPPRPLTPQSQRPPTGLRRRRQVGLTNKCAGKASNSCPKYVAGSSKDTCVQSEMGSEKLHSSRGTIVCHQSAGQLFHAVSAY
ncbi:hypothetical protein MPTK2_4g22110 [Marchantia polymorpha subsp. ruderalis]